MAEDCRLFWIWLAERCGYGSSNAVLLNDNIGNAREIYESEITPDDLTSAGIREGKKADELVAMLKNKSLETAKRALDNADRGGITVLTPDSPDYPSPLLSIRNYPMVLYCKGQLPDCRQNFLCAIVGTRSITEYGRKIAYQLGSGITFGGGIIVSGMALGADSMALAGALDSGGHPIAVLGTGVDVVYPREHKEIYNKIIAKGAVISEFPPGTTPNGRNFPIRNRIMSGISSATVVVEADMKSGALITAKDCIEQGRKLFAVPGKVGESNSEGTNSLLRDGAIPVITPEDVVSEFEDEYKHVLNSNLTHARMRNINYNETSKIAASSSKIGIEGVSNYYGNGVYGGRLRDYGKEWERTPPTPPAPDRKQNSAKKDNKPKPEPMTEQISRPAVNPETMPVETRKPSENADISRKPDFTRAIRELEPASNGKSAGKSKNPGLTIKGVMRAQSLLAGYIGVGKSNLGGDDGDSWNENKKMSEKSFIPAKKIELDMLEEKDVKVYNKMKPNVPVLPDDLADANHTTKEILSSLTVLEFAGAVESGGGGYYMRVSPDDIMQSEND